MIYLAGTMWGEGVKKKAKAGVKNEKKMGRSKIQGMRMRVQNLMGECVKKRNLEIDVYASTEKIQIQNLWRKHI